MVFLQPKARVIWSENRTNTYLPSAHTPEISIIIFSPVIAVLCLEAWLSDRLKELLQMPKPTRSSSHKCARNHAHTHITCLTILLLFAY